MTADTDQLIADAVRRGWLIDTGMGAYAVTPAGRRRAFWFRLARKVSKCCRAIRRAVTERRR